MAAAFYRGGYPVESLPLPCRAMLELAAPTDPAWAPRALAHLPELLVDHAHCEKKAAGTAVQLLFRYPEHTALLAPLSKLAREELSHFEKLLALLSGRGLAPGRHRPGPYAGRLRERERKTEPERLLDTLLCCALIEARSCERFGLLAKATADAELAGFFERLLAAEARHHRLYLKLAEGLAPAASVRARLRELALHEAAVLAQARFTGHLHGGTN
jgi:tRNA-(ms[2]io[6]A)-hydroxylase